MRSLQDWTRYLEEQEHDLQDSPRGPEPKVQEEIAPPAPVEQPTMRAEEEDVPAFLRVERPAPERPAPPAQAVEPPATPKPAPEPRVDTKTVAKAVNLRKRLPVDLKTESIGEREIAGSSYKTFKESREELIQRLVDPILSLEEVARILNVCPTTVRRYTNSGAIAHHRTAGNQRRFRLSDVLAFLEQQSGLPQE